MGENKQKQSKIIKISYGSVGMYKRWEENHTIVQECKLTSSIVVALANVRRLLNIARLAILQGRQTVLRQNIELGNDFASGVDIILVICDQVLHDERLN